VASICRQRFAHFSALSRACLANGRHKQLGRLASFFDDGELLELRGEGQGVD
jgi:hypothetical protein